MFRSVLLIYNFICLPIPCRAKSFCLTAFPKASALFQTTKARNSRDGEVPKAPLQPDIVHTRSPCTEEKEVEGYDCLKNHQCLYLAFLVAFAIKKG